jgi:hypothetical protein
LGDVEEGVAPQRMARARWLARVPRPALVALLGGELGPPHFQLMPFVLGHPADASERTIWRQKYRCKGCGLGALTQMMAPQALLLIALILQCPA